MMWGNGNTYSLLVEIESLTVTMEIIMVVPQEAGNQSTSRSTIQLLGI